MGASLAPRFFALMHERLRREGAIALQMELGQEMGAEVSDGIVDCLRTLQFHPVQAIQPARTVLLDLTADEEALLARMKEKWRYNVRLARRKGVQVRLARTIEDVRAWYGLLQITSERDKFGIHTFDYYLRAWNIFVPRNAAQLFLAEYQGQLLAGIFVGLFAKQGVYLYGASSNEQRQLMPNYLLQWEAMRWAKQAGATRYDLWGISETDDERDALAGVSRFKLGWGGEVVRFVGNYEYIYRPLRMRLARRLLPSLKG
jgi:lipid II:glycine glycyltransferase (peptidoglycan interpeptide bridge formation enzyme)